MNAYCVKTDKGDFAVIADSLTEATAKAMGYVDMLDNGAIIKEVQVI